MSLLAAGSANGFPGGSVQEGDCVSNGHGILGDQEHRDHPVIGFDWDAVEVCEEGERRRIEGIARVLALRWMADFVVKLAWFFVEGGRSKVEGAGIRAYVFAWCVLPRLGELSQTELARLLNRKHKQSVGREVSKFRDLFGFVCQHMQCEEARGVCVEREEWKRQRDGGAGLRRKVGAAVGKVFPKEVGAGG